MDQKFSVSSALSLGLELTKKNFLLIWGIILTSGVITGVISVFYNAAIQNEQYLLAFVLYFPVMIAAFFFTFNYYHMFLQLVDGKQPKFAELFNTKGNFVTFFLTVLLVNIMVYFGLIALVVPGVILGLMFGLAPLVVVDKQQGVMKALGISRKMTAGYRGGYFLLILALIGINILGSIPFGLGLIFTLPLTLMSIVSAYKLIRDEKYSAALGKEAKA